MQGSKQCPKCFVTLTARPITTLMCVLGSVDDGAVDARLNLRCPGSPDQKLQDVVDRIFPEFKVRDAELEEQFYAKHNFKRKANPELSNGVNGHSRAKANTRATNSHAATASVASSAKNGLNTQYMVEVYPQEE